MLGKTFDKTLRETVKNSGMGVPQKLPLGELILLVTLFAVLFRLLTLLGGNGEIVMFVATLAIGVSLGQAMMFDGERPRQASMIVGTFLCPMMVLIYGIASMLGFGVRFGWPVIISGMVFLTFVGPLLGYFAGLFVAGWFFIFDFYRSELTGAPRRYDQIVEERAKKQAAEIDNGNEQVAGKEPEYRLANNFRSFVHLFNPYQPMKPVRGALGAFLLTIAFGLMIAPLTPFGMKAVVTVLVLAVLAAIATGGFQYRWYVPVIAAVLCCFAGMIVYSRFQKIHLAQDQLDSSVRFAIGLGLTLVCILGGLFPIAFLGWLRHFRSRRSNTKTSAQIQRRPGITTFVSWLVLALLTPIGLIWSMSSFQNSPRERIASRIEANGGNVGYIPIAVAAVSSWPPQVQTAEFAKNANQDFPEFLKSHPETIQWLYISDPEFSEEHLTLIDQRRILGFYIENSKQLTGAVFGEFTDLSIAHMAFSECSLNDEGLANLAALPDLRRMLQYLSLVNTNCESLLGIDEFGGLQWLQIESETINGESIAWKKPLSVSSCSLDCPITNAGLQKLSESLPKCSRLSLANTKLTDSGMGHLSRFDGLTTISLTGKNFNDATVEALSKIDTLKDIVLVETSVTDEAVKRFLAARPECGIDLLD